MKTLKEEALAAATVVPVILVGSLAFVTITMPFVFPFAVVAAIAVAARRRTKGAPGKPFGRLPRRAKPFARSESSRPLAA
jgi:hypothetical protein